MNSRFWAIAALTVSLSVPCGAERKPGSAPEKALAPGVYTAKVKSLPCEGCANLIQKTLSKIKGVESSSVDLETSRLTLTLAPKSEVRKSLLDTRLKEAADLMGMGADYTLAEFKAEKAKAGPGKKPASR